MIADDVLDLVAPRIVHVHDTQQQVRVDAACHFEQFLGERTSAQLLHHFRDGAAEQRLIVPLLDALTRPLVVEP